MIKKLKTYTLGKLKTKRAAEQQEVIRLRWEKARLQQMIDLKKRDSDNV